MEERKKTTAIKSLKVSAEAFKMVKDNVYNAAYEAAEAGEPTAWCTVSVEQAILRAFDIRPLWPEHYGALCGAKQVILPMLEVSEAQGYSITLCSYARNCLGFLQRWKEMGSPPPEKAWKGMPKPTMIIADTMTCDDRYKWWQTIATRYFEDVPTHILDYPTVTPSALDPNDESTYKHYLELLVSQLKGMVEFIEKVLGRKLNIKKLGEVIEHTNRAFHAYDEIYELRKAIPAPMGSGDYFTCVIPHMYLMGTKEAIDFLERMRDELKWRVENKIGVVEEEKFRILWNSFPFWFFTGAFDYIQSYGAVSVIESIYYEGNHYGYDLDPNNPYESLARAYMHSGLQGAKQEGGMEAIESTWGNLKLAEDYKVDGMIANRCLSCRVGALGQLFLQDLLREKLGIPSMIVEADLADPRTFSEADFKRNFETFLESMATCKEKRKKEGKI